MNRHMLPGPMVSAFSRQPKARSVGPENLAVSLRPHGAVEGEASQISWSGSTVRQFGQGPEKSFPVRKRQVADRFDDDYKGVRGVGAVSRFGTFGATSLRRVRNLLQRCSLEVIATRLWILGSPVQVRLSTPPSARRQKSDGGLFLVCRACFTA